RGRDAELAVRRGEEPLHLLLPGDVRPDGDGAPAPGPDLLGHAPGGGLVVDVVHADGVAAATRQPCRGGPDAAAAAGHDDHRVHRASGEDGRSAARSCRALPDPAGRSTERSSIQGPTSSRYWAASARLIWARCVWSWTTHALRSCE